MIRNDQLVRRPKIKPPMSKKRKKIIIFSSIGGGLLLIGLGLFLYFVVFAQQPTEEPPPAPEPEPVRYYSPLTGLETSEENTKRAVTAVMIENSPEARPQSALDGKNVVFEAVAEGGITRFVMLYQEWQPKLIGPVRSVRPYYLEWATGFDSALAHVGGSARGLEMIQSGNYALDLDQYYNDSAYWRTTDRYMPHNVYTDAKHLNNLEASKGKLTSSFEAWQRQDGAAILPKAETEEASTEITTEEHIFAQKISLPVSDGIFAVQYNYNQASNKYQRWQGGEKHIDANTNKQIAPDAVIAIMVGLGAAGEYSDYDTIGHGTAYIFQNGTVVKAKWRKSSAKQNIKFVDADGEDIAINRGQVWVTAISTDEKVTWK
ncbi:MAG: DUF3048 domain-containing protein [Candidatus Nomurabacteria bacterium]|jgi:hypothetical protein|nr:DUF3048 domain-containing protein [Candidatus Nomurabacteria bacterium]